MIKIDMEMPESCDACPCGFETQCFVLNKYMYEHGIDQRRDDCPLIEDSEQEGE